MTASALVEALAPPARPVVDPAPDLRVETVTDPEAFLALEPVWNRLLEAAGIDAPFLTHEWLHSWWEAFGAGHQLRILVVHDGAVPVAIAPLMFSRIQLYGATVRRLGLIANVHSPRTEFIVPNGQVRAAYRAIWRHLAREASGWDMLELCQVPSGSPLIEELPRLAVGDGFLTGRWEAGDSPYLSLTGDWTDFLSGLDRKHRSNLRNALKRLSAMGAVRLETVTAPDLVQDALEEGFQIEAAAWKGQAGTGMGCRPELRHFYTALSHRLAASGWLRVHFLTVNGRRIAFGYHVRRGSRLYLIKSGYLPDYAAYSPTSLMCSMVLQEAFAEGTEECDFLGDATPWKAKWTSLARPHTWLYAFPPRWRTRALHWAKFRLVPALQRADFLVKTPDRPQGLLA